MSLKKILFLFLSLLLITACTMLPSTQTHTLTATSSPGGTINPEGELSVNQGASQSFTFTPDPGYEIDEVLIDGVSIGVVTTYTFTDIDQDHTLYAVFTQQTYTLTAIPAANGSISPQGEITLSSGASQSFTFTPDPGYEIDEVLIDGVSVGAVTTYTLTDINQNHTLQASFQEHIPAQIYYSITTSAAQGGEITPNGKIWVLQGQDKTFTITPDPGYEIDDVLIDDVSIEAVSSYSFTNVTQQHTISAHFIPLYTLSLSADPTEGGTASDLSSAAPYRSGTEVQIQATCSEHYRFLTWSAPAGTFANETAPETTFTMPEEDVTITAHFELNQYTLTLEVKGRGHTLPEEGTHTYPAGSQVDLKAFADSECVCFTGWSGDLTYNSSKATLTMDADKTVTASFGLIENKVYNQDTLVNYPTIQEAIDDADPDQTIIVCPGTYYENIVLEDKEITLRSCDPEDPAIVAATVLDGQELDSVVKILNSDGATLRGFTIRNGYSTEYYVGGGITVYTCANITITDNHITDNTADYYGGGISLEYGENITITDNHITGNTASEYGGGMDLDNSTNITVTNNTITGNTAGECGGGGIDVYTCTNTTITNNTISDNTAYEGGGIYVYDCNDTTIQDNAITDNTAEYLGGGIEVYYYCDNTTIQDNTISGNTAEYLGGGIYVDSYSNLLPDTARPTGWGTGRENLPIDNAEPPEPIEGPAGNTFSGNRHDGLQYTEGAHVYFE